jgi:uncharacterized membrane protein
MRKAHVFLAVTLIGLGVLGLVTGNFAPSWSGVPKTFPARNALPYLCAIVELVTGAGLLWKRTALNASRVLFGWLVLWFVVFRVPLVVQAPTSSGIWWACGATAMMTAAAWVLFASVAATGDRHFLTSERGVRIARVIFGLGLIPVGIAHFTFFQHTVDDVPGWLPWRPFWAALTGATFIAAGVAIVTNVCARLAAKLTTAQIALFTVIVWVPIIVRHPTPGDWNEFIESWTLTAFAWVVADLAWARDRDSEIPDLARK